MWLALVLSGHCRELSHLLPLHCGSADQEWLKRFEKDGAASLLLSKSGWKVTRVIEELQVVGIPLTSITFNAGFDLFWRSWKGLLSLLDLAVLQEDSALAARLACAGVSLSRNVVHCIIAENFKLADDDAAMIAVRAASGHEICTKRVVILQVFQKIWGGRTPPAELLKEVLALSIDVPEMVRELDLPEVWDVWEKSWASLNSAPCQEPSSKAASIGGEVRIQQEASVQAMHEVDDPPEPSISKTTGENDDTLRALQASRNEVPAPPLNTDGVRLFRLTRMKRSKHVADVLLDPEGPLAALHQRVMEAGCEVDPDWSPLYALFVPITETQMDELIGLADDGYELLKDEHILALESDGQTMNQAFRSNIAKAGRPAVKIVDPNPTQDNAEDIHNHQQADAPDEEGPMLVVEEGFRTDSSLGFPASSFLP